LKWQLECATKTGSEAGRQPTAQNKVLLEKSTVVHPFKELPEYYVSSRFAAVIKTAHQYRNLEPDEFNRKPHILILS
jgi:hypothetical protein